MCEYHIPSDHCSLLAQIFVANDWFGPGNGLEGVHDRFCKLLGRLNVEEQKLVLQLTKRFRKYPMGQYRWLFLKACEQLKDGWCNTGNNIYFVPMNEPKDSRLTKSGEVMSYLAKTECSGLSPFAGRDITYFNSIDGLKSGRAAQRQLATVVLVDDYVGTGRTAITAINYYKQFAAKEDDKLVVLALVMHRVGLERLWDCGYLPVLAELTCKGIEDCDDIDDKDTARRLMQAIEEKMKVSAGYRFGFGQSEDTVSMMRTPNNTFPVFWWSGNSGIGKWPAPFER